MELFFTVIWALFILFSPLPISFYWATRLDSCGTLKPSLTRLLLFTLTIAAFFQICIALSLGLFHLFSPKYVFTTYLLIAITCLSRPIRQNIRQAAGENLFLIKQDVSAPEITILFLWVTIFFAVFFRNLCIPISNFDSLAYHLPNMATWLQTGSFTMVDSSLLFQVNRYPYGWQAINALLLMPFRNDILVTVPTILSLFIFGLTIFCLARHFSQHRLPALLTAFLATTLPIEIELLNSVQVDLAFAAFCLISVYAAILFATTRNQGHAMIGLIALSLLPGIKINGILYCAVLTIWGFALCLLMRRHQSTYLLGICQHHRQKFPPYTPWLIGLFCLWVAGFWYIRNWVVVGNPLGYVPLKIGTFTVFPGEHIVSVDYLKHTSLAALMKVSSHVSDWQIILDQIELRFGLPFFILALFITPSLRHGFLADKQKKNIYALLLLLLVCSIYLYWTSPYTGASGSGPPAEWRIHPWIGWNLRFALFSISLLAILASLGMEALSLPLPVTVAIAAIAWAVAIGPLLGMPPANPTDNRYYLTLYSPILAFAFSFFKREKSFRLSIVAQVFIYCMIICGFALPFANAKRISLWDKSYDGIPSILEKTMQPHETVGYLSLIKIFPLFGKDLQRKVVDISGKASDYGEFIDFIKERNISCIVEENLSYEGTKEIEWINRPDFMLSDKEIIRQKKNQRGALSAYHR